jgi:hypothetical protein
VIPPALADKREDAYAGVERWSEAFKGASKNSSRQVPANLTR